MKAINMKSASWIDNGRKATFMSSAPGFGIQRGDGLFISRDGISPCVWRTKRTVESILPYADAFEGHTWVSVTA